MTPQWNTKPGGTRPLLAAAGVLMLSGCATSSDPHQGGFFSGVKGVAGGGYDRRQQEREAELARMKAQQTEAEARAAAARTLVAQRRSQVTALRDDLAALDATIGRQQARIGRLSAGGARAAARNRARAERLAALRARVTSLRGNVGAGIDAAEYDRARQEYLSVQRAIDAIDDDAPLEQRP